ncbi:hypothetical protein ON010_g7641 [Phytophthora cinnamomi]|nr:hypothetical protein ON010_g7641 [Phytophthora cinnamomi]
MVELPSENVQKNARRVACGQLDRESEVENAVGVNEMKSASGTSAAENRSVGGKYSVVEQMFTMGVVDASGVFCRVIQSSASQGRCNDAISRTTLVLPRKICYLDADWERFRANPAYELLNEYKDTVFRPELLEGLPGKREIEHRIDVRDPNLAMYRLQWRQSPAQQLQIVGWVEDMVKKKLIRPSISAYAAPTFCVRKAVGWRMAHDYRYLDSNTNRRSVPMTRKEDIMDDMAGAYYFLTMDRMYAYYLVRMRGKDSKFTAFQAPNRLWEYLVLPMELFCDDIYIFTKSQDVNAHLEDLRKTLDNLRGNKRYVKLAKYVFCASEIPCLGYFVGRQGVLMYPAKVPTIRDRPVPRTQEELHSFLGLTGYIRRFCPAYASLAATMFNLLKKQKKRNWKIHLHDEQIKNFKELKRRLCNPPVLHIPDFSRPIYLQTDASKFAVGGVLFQVVDGTERPIALSSRKMKPAELNYPRQLLAIVYALAAYRICCLDKPPIVETDHQSLEGLFKPDLQPEAKYFHDLSVISFDDPSFSLEISEVTADIYSLNASKKHTRRIAVYKPFRQQPSCVLARRNPSGNIRTSTCTDISLKIMVCLGTQSPVDEHPRVVIPNNETLRQDVIREYHDTNYSGHASAERTYLTLARHEANHGSLGQQVWSSLSVFQISISMDFITDLPRTKRANDQSGEEEGWGCLSIPRIDETLDNLHGARRFTSLDLHAGYWQVSVTAADRDKSMTNATLRGRMWHSCLVYLNDVIVFAKGGMERHIVKMAAVLERLAKTWFSLKTSKYSFATERLENLGHELDADGVRPMASLVHTVQEFPVPTDVTELKRFVHMAGYYRRFVPAFASKASPKQGGRMEVGGAATAGVGLGAAPTQDQGQRELPTAYASKINSPVVVKYSITDVECAAVVWAIKLFRPYLYGRKTWLVGYVVVAAATRIQFRSCVQAGPQQRLGICALEGASACTGGDCGSRKAKAKEVIPPLRSQGVGNTERTLKPEGLFGSSKIRDQMLDRACVYRFLVDEHAASRKAAAPAWWCTINFKTGKHAVKQHMEVYHPDDIKSFMTARQRWQDERQTTEIVRNLNQTFAEAADSSTTPLRPITGDQQKRFNRLVAKWPAYHFRPMVIVEDEGFVDFVRIITEDLGRMKVKVPKRTQLRHEIVVLAADFLRRVQDDIRRCYLYFSITTDIWTARNTRSYISLTIHYIDEAFYLKNWTLEVQEIPGIHDGKAIAAAIAKMMEDWSLSKVYCTRLLSDRGSNVVKAAELLELPCIAHTLHLINVKNDGATILEHEEDEPVSNDDRETMDRLQEFAIDDISKYLDETISSLQRNELDAMRVIVQHFRSIAVYFRKSPKARHRLGAIQAWAYNIVVNLQVDCPTRWSSYLERSALAGISFLDPRVARRTPHLSTVDIPNACESVVRAAAELAQQARNTPFRTPSGLHQQVSAPATNTPGSFNLSDHMFGPDESEQQSSDSEQVCNKELKLDLADVKKSVVAKTNPLE